MATPAIPIQAFTVSEIDSAQTVGGTVYTVKLAPSGGVLAGLDKLPAGSSISITNWPGSLPSVGATYTLGLD